MGDRELLELAAKASNTRFVGHGRNGLARGRNGSCLVDWWNPLEDDGDALRLALALKMDFIFSHDAMESVFANNSQFAEAIDGNAPRAARRAIVRAAAHIGKAMP